MFGGGLFFNFDLYGNAIAIITG